jgi:MinD superfamily P-loop ATPase
MPEEADEKCAWCNECEAVRQKNGGWNDESEAFAQITMICDACFEAARLRNAAATGSRRRWRPPFTLL